MSINFGLWTLVIAVALAFFGGLAVFGFMVRRSMAKTFEGLDFEFTDAEGKQLLQGFANRYWIDHEVVVKIFDREMLEKYYGALFDTNGDIRDLTKRDSVVRGFVSSLVELDGHLNTPAAIRRRLGLDDPFYDKAYGGDVYVMTLDLSDHNLRFEVPVAETAAGLALFQEGGLTSGGARELQLSRPIPAWERIDEIRRVTSSGYGKPFTPHASSTHAIIGYQRKNPESGEIEKWNPWRDEQPDAWAVHLLRITPGGM